MENVGKRTQSDPMETGCGGMNPSDCRESVRKRLSSLRSKRSFSTKRASKRFSANWPRGIWGKRLRERLQEDPLFLKNPFVHDRGLLIGAAQSQ